MICSPEISLLNFQLVQFNFHIFYIYIFNIRNGHYCTFSNDSFYSLALLMENFFTSRGRLTFKVVSLALTYGRCTHVYGVVWMRCKYEEFQRAHKLCETTETKIRKQVISAWRHRLVCRLPKESVCLFCFVYFCFSGLVSGCFLSLA